MNSGWSSEYGGRILGKIINEPSVFENSSGVIYNSLIDEFEIRKFTINDIDGLGNPLKFKGNLSSDFHSSQIVGLTSGWIYLINCSSDVVIEDLDTLTIFHRHDIIIWVDNHWEYMQDFPIDSNSVIDFSDFDGANLTATLNTIKQALEYKELLDNKTDQIIGNETSIIKYPNVKGVVDWVSLLYQSILTAINFGAFLLGLTSKDTIVDADIVSSSDSADTNKAKKTSWLNIWINYIKVKADLLYQSILTAINFGAFLFGLTAKDTIVDSDIVASSDSEDTNKAKKTTWLNIWINYFKPKTDSTYQNLHGFENLTDTTFTDFTTSAGTFIFTLIKINNYNVLINGNKSQYTTNKTVDLMLSASWGNGTTDPIGQWYIRIDGSGNLSANKNAFDILDITTTMVSVVWVQNIGGSNFEGIVSDERHNYKRNLLVHKQLHNDFGTQYVSGFDTLVIGNGVANNSTNTFSINGGVMNDEDIFFNILSQTTSRIGYKDGANNYMKFDSASTTYAKLNGLVPRYDNNGTLTDINVGKYGIYWAFETNRMVKPFVIIVGQAVYNSVSEAQAILKPTLYGFTVAEWRLCYRVIVRNNAGSLNWIQSDPIYNVNIGLVTSGSSGSIVSASNVTTAPTSTFSSTNAQAMFSEVDTKKEPTITSGSSTNYIRGDKTLGYFRQFQLDLGSSATQQKSFAVSWTNTGNTPSVNISAVSDSSSDFIIAIVQKNTITINGCTIIARRLDANSSWGQNFAVTITLSW